MKYLIIFSLLISVNIVAIPILVDVQISQKSGIEVEWKIENQAENMRIELGCFHKKEKIVFELDAKKISGDFGEITPKNSYKMVIAEEELIQDFGEYTIFPKLFFNDRIYYEMSKIPMGNYHLISENVIETIATKSFYVSKFEITNEQYLAFINSDGYDLKNFWNIAKDVMSNQEVGWNYQGSLMMSKPKEWDFKLEPHWKNATSNFIYGPVTNIRWFEANAFCNWMHGELPNLTEMKVAFSVSIDKSVDFFESYYLNEQNRFPLQNVKSGVSEWLASGVPPVDISCAAGCNEMYFLKNNGEMRDEPFEYSVKCPLYRSPFLGIRMVIPSD